MSKIVPTVLIALLLTAPVSAAERLVSGGIVRGEDMPDGSTIFRGIPYAAPPVGDLRWKPPAPVAPWAGIRDAIKPPPPCLQHDEGWNAADAAASKEDCLYLSIHSPQHNPTDRLPVMFWIHGGSNRAGSGLGYVDSTIHSRGVVLVSIEYRLDVFGFLASPALSAESPARASGNYAIMDQIAALRWVKDNIARFGGDPHNVTVFGQSAGAYDVGVLLLSPLARGLFHKAIEESGTPGVGFPPRSASDNEKIGSDLATLVGVGGDADGLKALRDAPADVLLKEGDKLVPPNGVDPSAIWGQAMVDGYVLPRAPAEILAAKAQAPVPYMIGNNTREFPVDMPDDAVRAMAKSLYGGNADQALILYKSDDPALGTLATRLLTDAIFRCPTGTMARWQMQAGQKVWRYQFGLGVPGSGRPVEHSSELRYVFDAAPADATFATWPPVQAYWTNFARSGNPNGKGLPVWPGFGRDKAYMDFTPQGPTAGKDLRGAICRLLPGG